MTEPSRDTAGRRRRELLAVARELEEEIGVPDQSAIAYTYADGWTVRRVVYLHDQQREGHLLKNCLRGIARTDDNCWSLRDRDNLPRITFNVWRIDADDDLSEIPAEIGPLRFLRGSRFLLMPDVPHGLKDDRRAQLFEFANADVDIEDVPRFPSTRAERVRAITRALHAPPVV